MYDGSRQAILCHVGGNNNKKKNIVCPPLVGGKKKNVRKVDHVIENLEHFWTNYTDFMVDLKKKILYICRKKICHVGGEKKIAG